MFKTQLFRLAIINIFAFAIYGCNNQNVSDPRLDAAKRATIEAAEKAKDEKLQEWGLAGTQIKLLRIGIPGALSPDSYIFLCPDGDKRDIYDFGKKEGIRIHYYPSLGIGEDFCNYKTVRECILAACCNCRACNRSGCRDCECPESLKKLAPKT